jgi:hypothetical protein
MTGGTEDAPGFSARLFQAAGLVAALLVVVTVVFGAAVGDNAGEAASIVGMAIAVAAAAAGVGVLLGFLFGIPRTLQREDGGESGAPRYLANTNLEQISDWLTKILVGITLVQIGNAGAALARLADALGPMLGGQPASAGFGLAVCIVASLSGFMLSYLWTRLRLRRELQIADRDIQAAVREVVDERAAADANALSLVERQLSGQNPPTFEELAKALGAASQPVLIQTYQRAEDQRTRSWREPSRAQELERTIGVFRALIANDPDRRFHRHFGSLGYALKDYALKDYVLKDRKAVDLGDAIDALSTAIGIRGTGPKVGFRLYEWSRAACRILQITDPAATAPAQRAEIEPDLRAATRSLGPDLFGPANSQDTTVQAVNAWLTAQNLTYDNLRS